MEEVDIWRSANFLIQEHGTRALVEATKRSVELMEEGDEDGAVVWRRIIIAVDALMRGKPLPGGERH